MKNQISNNLQLYAARHTDRECRYPEAMDGNIGFRRSFFSQMNQLLIYLSHPCVLNFSKSDGVCNPVTHVL
jgi:hypothetical protein